MTAKIDLITELPNDYRIETYWSAEWKSYVTYWNHPSIENRDEGSHDYYAHQARKSHSAMVKEMGSK